MQEIKFTALEPVGGSHIGKTFDVTDSGSLIKGLTRSPQADKARVVRVDGLRGLHTYISDHFHEHYCVCWGTTKTDGPFIVMSRETANDSFAISHVRAVDHDLADAQVISRSNSFITHSCGVAVLSVDNDPTPMQEVAGEIKSPQDVIDELALVCPEFAKAARIELHSSSSFISVDGKQVVGAKGVRLLFSAVIPQGEVGFKRVMDRVHTRLALLGKYSFKFSTRGALLIRTCVDTAVYPPSQPDYVGSPKMLSSRVTQSRPAPRYVDGATEPLDVYALIPELTEEEKAAFRALQLKLEAENRDQMRAIYSEWENKRVEESFTRPSNKKTKDQIRATLRRVLSSDGGYLPVDIAIKLDHGPLVAGRDILADPSKYINQSIASPIEPSYGAEDGASYGIHKGKIIRIGRHVGVIDYAHGAKAKYIFVDDSDLDQFDTLIDASTDTQDSDASSVVDCAEGEATSVKPAEEVVGEAPFGGAFYFGAKTLDGEGVQQAAKELVRHQIGLRVAAGYLMEKAAAEEFFRSSSGSIFVPSYADAVFLRRWIASVAPEKTSMIMPSRTVDQGAKRRELGSDLFAFIDSSGDWVGTTDEICPKRKSVEKLHDLGLATVSGHTCMSPRVDGSWEYCPHFKKCGRIKRVKAKPRHDFVIEMMQSARGPDNIAIESPEARGGDMLFLGTAGVPTADVLKWPYATWDTEDDVLAPVLKALESGLLWCDKQKAKDLGIELPTQKRVEEWGGDVAVSPKMDADETLRRVDHHKASLGDGWGEQWPSPILTARAIVAWLSGTAMMKISVKEVQCYMRDRLRRLDGVKGLLAADDPLSLVGHIGRLAEGDAGDEGQTLRVSKRMLPTNVTQVVPTRLNNPVGWLRKGRGCKETPGVRDLFASLDLLCAELGDGVVFVDKEALSTDLVKRLRGITVLPIQDISVSSVRELVPDGAHWAAFLGRSHPSDTTLRATLMSMPSHMWPASISPGGDGVVRHRVKPAYVDMNGTLLEAPKDARWRWAGVDETADAALVSAVARPVLLIGGRLAELEAQDGKPRSLVVFDGFPLALAASSDTGILTKAVMSVDDLPPSTWLAAREKLIEIEGEQPLGRKKQGARREVLVAAGAGLGIKKRQVLREVRRSDAEYEAAISHLLGRDLGE